MKKIQPIDESGRRMAEERYGHLGLTNVSRHGHSQMHRDMRPKFETPNHMADQRRGVQAKHDIGLTPYEKVQDAPGDAAGGTIKHDRSAIHERHHNMDRGAKAAHPDHHHKHVKRDGGYGAKGHSRSGNTPYPGQLNVKGPR